MINSLMNNTTLQNYVTAAKANIPSLVVEDSEFFLSGLDQFSMAIIPDTDESSDKQEPDYGSLLSSSFADSVISDEDDIPVHYIHIMGHKKCDEMWNNSPVNKYDLERHEYDFIEEIYSQRLIQVVAPVLYESYPALIAAYDTIHSQGSSTRTTLNTLLTPSVSNQVPSALKVIHQSLYAADPLQQSTFNMYVTAWDQALKNSTIKELVRVYEYGE